MNGKQKIALSTVIALVVSLVTALTFYFTMQGSILADVQENRARIELQERQTERVFNKLERIEALLIEKKK